MGIAQDAAEKNYSKMLKEQGAAGTPLAAALMHGFADGFISGHKAHANIVVQSLQVLLDEFQEPVSIKSARERVEQLQLAIKHGSDL